MKTALPNNFIKLFVLFTFILSSAFLIGQNKEYSGTKVQIENGKSAIQTIPLKNSSTQENIYDHLKGIPGNPGQKYALGGSVVWDFTDPAAIANTARLNGDGKNPIVAWGLNNMRVSFYGDANNVPLWEYTTVPTDPNVDISEDNSVIAVTKGFDFYLLDNATGSEKYHMTLGDTLYASQVGVSRDGSKVVFTAQAFGSGTITRIFGLDLSGPTLVVDWTYDLPYSETQDWRGVNFSASGNRVVVSSRYRIFVFDAENGELVWGGYLDNSEAPAVISGDGKIIATADNSGFVQAKIFNQTTNEYELLWQYRVPAGIFTNWASSVGISADGNTIVAGTMIFVSGSAYDGTVIAFDTYGDGTPKWLYSGAGDLVDDIAVSDDGRVAAAVTWGDLSHTKPDLMVFDVETGTLTYDVVSPGSFFTVDISPNGDRVIGGGKAVHAREFGSGGRLYLVNVDLGGGYVTGDVDLTGTTDDSGVIVRALGTERFGITDAEGNYIIPNITPGTYTIRAEKPGYNFGEVTNVSVTAGNTTSGINFVMAPSSLQAPVINATTNLVGAIGISWTSLFRNAERELEILKAVGDYNPNETRSVINEKPQVEKPSFSFTDIMADSVAIYRSPVSGGPYTKIAVVLASQNSYMDSAVFPLKDYYYVATRINETGESVYSSEVMGKVNDELLTLSIIASPGSVPTIDGIISSGEWNDAVKVDVSDVLGYGSGTPKPQGSVYMYFKFDDDNDMLYIAGEDFLNPTLNDNEGFGLYFDDNNNNNFEGTGGLPLLREGNFWAYWHPGGADLRFREIFTNGGVGTVTTITDGQVAFTESAGYVQGEASIPLGFDEGYQLQIFSPDRTVGLGAFMSERSTSAAIFDGWWPQTMNSLFIPRYFGDVKIDASLFAPPQTPGNIAVTKSDNNLLINWDDPELGLNNDPLPSPAKINLYRNGELLETIEPGVESYIDYYVDCERWYEYKLESFFIQDSDTFFSPISNPYGDFACQDPILTPLTYDDGEWDAFYVVNFGWDGYKWANKFTPSFYPARVLRLKNLVNDASPFDYTINEDSSGYPGRVIAGPFRVSSGGVSGVAFPLELTLPGDEPPVFESGEFWVLINYIQQYQGYPGIGVDTDPPGNGRGMYYTFTDGWQPFPNNLMITAFIADPPPLVSVDDKKLPLTYELMQNYPNPFNPATVIKYQIPKEQFVTIEIFNSLGQKVRTLVNEMKEAGSYSVNWDGNNNSGISTASGMYLYRIKAGNFTQVRKMMLLR